MRRLFAVLAAFCTVAGAWADVSFSYNGYNFTSTFQVRLYNYPNRTNGGAFWVGSRINGDADPDGVPGYGYGNNLFSTFCIESQTANLNFNTPYWATIDDHAYDGDGGSTGGRDLVSNVTEYIYRQWLGVAASLNNNVPNATQQLYSQAIWAAENESGGARNSVFLAAVDAVISVDPSRAGWTNAEWATFIQNFAGSTSVKALNLWTVNAEGVVTDIQSQLILIPLPGAALLGALGLGIAGWAKRRMA